MFRDYYFGIVDGEPVARVDEEEGFLVGSMPARQWRRTDVTRGTGSKRTLRAYYHDLESAERRAVRP